MPGRCCGGHIGSFPEYIIRPKQGYFAFTVSPAVEFPEPLAGVISIPSQNMEVT